MDYVKKNSHCSFHSEGNKVNASCSFTVYNYGKEDEITIKPILEEWYEVDIRFEPKRLRLRKHSKYNFSTQFEGVQIERTGFSGSARQIGAAIELRGIPNDSSRCDNEQDDHH